MTDVKRTGFALAGAVLGLGLLSVFPGSQAGAAGGSGTTTLTLTAGVDTSSARPFTFEHGVAYDITVSDTLTYNYSSSPPLTCIHDVFYYACSQTGTPPGSWQRQDVLEVFDDPHHHNTNSALPGSNTMTVTFNSNHSYSWVVPANQYPQTTTKYFWANPWGEQGPYTTTYSGHITVSITPHVQHNRFGFRFTAVGLPKNPPGGLKDVTLAGSGRIQLSDYNSTPGETSSGTGTSKVTEVEQIKVGSGPEKKRTIKLTQSSGRASITNVKGGGESADISQLVVTQSNDPNCQATLSTAYVFVRDATNAPDRVHLVLLCESATTQHTFDFSFLNGAHKHVTTAIVGPQ